MTICKWSSLSWQNYLSHMTSSFKGVQKRSFLHWHHYVAALSSIFPITRSGIHFNDANFLFMYVIFPSHFSALKMCIFIVAKFDNCWPLNSYYCNHMYAVQPILKLQGVDLGSKSEKCDAEQSQMHLSPNMRTNGSIYIELI